MLERLAEPDLMDDMAQAEAYAMADFAAPHDTFVALYQDKLGPPPAGARVLDLGCGPGDVCVRFARRYGDCSVVGLEGAAAMLEFGARIVADAGLQSRVQLRRVYLPVETVADAPFDAVISNSLLHHLRDPLTLWSSIRRFGRPGAPVFVMDLMRPESCDSLRALVEEYASGEPEILQRDFAASLHAAYRPDEVRQQLQHSGLEHLAIEVVSDRHLIVFGHL